MHTDSKGSRKESVFFYGLLAAAILALITVAGELTGTTDALVEIVGTIIHSILF